MQTMLDLVPTNHLAKWDNCRAVGFPLALQSPLLYAKSGVTPLLDQSLDPSEIRGSSAGKARAAPEPGLFVSQSSDLMGPARTGGCTRPWI